MNLIPSLSPMWGGRVHSKERYIPRLRQYWFAIRGPINKTELEMSTATDNKILAATSPSEIPTPQLAVNKHESRRFDPLSYALIHERSDQYASDLQTLWKWSGTHWLPLSDDEGERDALRWIYLNDRRNAAPANARAAHRATVLWATALKEPDSGEVVLPLKNGYLWLRNDGALELRKHDPAVGLRHLIACEYRPDEPPPAGFHAFLDRVLPDKMVQERVREYVGYTLLQDARYQLAQIWLGSGSNGKGVLANIIQALHAKIAAVHLDNLNGFALSGMIGASLLYCDEAPRKGLDEQKLKSLIAGESVQVDRKYQAPLTLKVNGKWLILANHYPSIGDQSHGFWRRFDIIPFDVTIPETERIPMLAETIIRSELAGVLNWALGGLLNLLARGHFSHEIPESVRAAKAAGQLETNSVAAWWESADLDWYLKPATPKEDVYLHYSTWCRDNGMSPLAAPKFWGRVGQEHEKELLESRPTIKGKRVRLCNIRLPGLLPPDECLNLY
ncbi:MAG: DUF5906 domain-containing protein [Sulfuricella denitrificans]|nr:DUF5906 domain-containing protein [Sulfuricella denitrificans]